MHLCLIDFYSGFNFISNSKMKLSVLLAIVLFPITILAQVPTITDFTPTSAASGATVTINGTNFTADATVSFGVTAAASVNFISATQITAVVANGSSGDLSVTTLGGTGSLAGFTYDNVPPSVAITSSAPDPTNTTIPVTITFNESVTGFVAAGISVINGTVTSFVGSGTDYTATITPTAPGLVEFKVDANAALDAASNGNTASNTLTRTYDNTQPTVAITSSAPNPTNTTIPVTITFSKSVTGFEVTDISVTNGTAGSFAGSGTTYTVDISPTGATVSVSVAANVALDAASNGNTASNTLTRTYDNTQPTVAITSSAAEPTNISPIPVTITFSESVTGFVLSDISVTNGTAANFNGSGTTYTANITPSAAGSVTVSVADNVAMDAATNGNTSSLAKFTFAPPTITGFSPISAAAGAIVTITGTNFLTTPSVSFNGTLATETTFTSTQIKTKVPINAVTGPISISVNGIIITSGSNFTLLPTPTISGFSPASGASGTPVNISGTNFYNISSISFNGTSASIPTSFTPLSFDTSVPSGATTGLISIDVNGITLTTSIFTVLPTPTILNFSPTSGAIGATISINGSNFGSTPSVTFNGVAAIVNSSNATSISVTVPTGASTGKISISTNGITITSATDFNVLPTPTIINFTPTSGAVGATVIINGSNFDLSPTVSINGTVASVSSSSATSITAIVPAGATTGTLAVTASGVEVLSVGTFTVMPTPTISGFSPVSGAVGATVIISGSNFSNTPGDVIVKFNNNKTAVVTSSSINSITTTVPAGATSGKISVTVSGVTLYSTSNFTVLPTPTITGFSPTGALSGTTVTITGTNFDLTTANNVVKFNGVAAVVTGSTSTSITTSVPLGAGTGPISVTTSGVTINSTSNFTVFGTPSITGFNPTNGAYGVTVTISGTNFSSVPSENTVKFNGISSVVTTSTTTSITTTVPVGATTGPISVTFNGITGNSSTNFIVPTPTITDFTPNSGAVGATVILTGTNFNATSTNNNVTFNGVAALVTASSTTSLTVMVPAGAMTGKISVSVNGVPGESTSNFTVLPTPTITSFSPISGAVGANVIINGTNFSTTPGDHIVKFNNTTAIVKASTNTSITTTIPAGSTTGLISITVSGVTITSISDFTILPTPTLTGFTPTGGAVGASVTISGTNFSTTPNDLIVKFNNTSAVVTSSTTTSITTTVPSGAVTGPITITVSGVTITSSSNFNILPFPTFTSFSPTDGAPGTSITITGTNFNAIPANNSVAFNGISTVVTNATTNSLSTTVPVGASTGPISLTTSGVTITSATNFNVLPTPSILTLSPASGAVGAIVTITGTNFDLTPTYNVITFNGVTSLVTASTSTSLTTIVPSGATTGKIALTLNGVTVSSGLDFTVMPSPTITSFSPVSGVVGTVINITGSNFSSDETANTVTFNGIPAVVEASSSTVLTTTVPAGAKSGPISIMVNGVTVTSLIDFEVLTIDTTPPVLVLNNTATEVTPGSNLLISAQFNDPESEVVNASVIFESITNRTEAINISLTKSGDYWEFIIPAVLIGELGVEYKLQATNNKGLTYISPSFIQVKVRLTDNGLTIPYNSFGTSIGSYRIISMPLNLDKPSVQDVLNELPTYDKTLWRISHYENGTNENRELLPTDPLLPGVGYWLLIKDNPGVSLTSGAGTTVDTNPSFAIQLKAGWNQIGNPYDFNLQWSDLVAANAGLPVTFRSFNGSIKNFEDKTVLNKMEGGFVNVASAMQLVFPTKKNTSSRTATSQGLLENSIDQNDWEVDFNVTQGDISNVISGLGMRHDASNDFDIYDGFSMPHFTEFLDVNHQRKLNQYHYSKDIVASADNHTWNFEVSASNSERLATITWNNQYFGINDFNLILFDENANVWIDMKQHHTYSFTPPTNFKVIYGTENYVSKEIVYGNAKIIEVSPNPSHGPIKVHLFLPEWQKSFPVQLELKSLNGISLATIYTGDLVSGYQEIEWLGDSNQKLPSGVYLVQMRSNHTVQTIRVLLLN